MALGRMGLRCLDGYLGTEQSLSIWAFCGNQYTIFLEYQSPAATQHLEVSERLCLLDMLLLVVGLWATTFASRLSCIMYSESCSLF